MSVTIAELFPFYLTASKWMKAISTFTPREDARLIDEYTEHTIEYSDKKIKLKEYYTVDSDLHKEDGPAFIQYFHGKKSAESWWNHNKWHREDGPAFTEYDDDGKIVRLEWHHEDIWHRTDGPALIYFDAHGEIKEESWYFNGKCHRRNAPACTHYFDRKITRVEYWSFGKFEYYKDM